MYLQHEGYLGTIEPDLESMKLTGKLAFIRDLVTYEANTLDELTTEFKKAVEDYLQSCQELNKEPQKPCKGSFSVRTGEELHRDAVVAAGTQSLNSFVCSAIKEKVDRVKATKQDQQ